MEFWPIPNTSNLICLKIWATFSYLSNDMNCRHWLDTTFCGIWPSCKLFAQEYLSKYISMDVVPALNFQQIHNRNVGWKPLKC